MYKNGKYRETDKMSDLICENYPMVLVMSRFGIALGFGEKNIGEVCRQNGVDPCTFLTVVNFLTEEISAPMTNIDKCLSIEALITYLHNAHAYFLDFRLPHIRRKLTDAIADCPKDVAFVITKFFDEYAAEVHKHMSYEEKTVFPYVRGLLKGIKDPKYNITIFRKHHDQIEMKIIELKNILIKYYPGPGSNLLNSVLFDIFATEQDLASHNHVEDSLFVPAILTLDAYERLIKHSGCRTVCHHPQWARSSIKANSRIPHPDHRNCHCGAFARDTSLTQTRHTDY